METCDTVTLCSEVAVIATHLPMKSTHRAALSNALEGTLRSICEFGKLEEINP